MYFIGINVIGLLLNMSLYYIDIYHNNGILDKVEGDEKEEEREKSEWPKKLRLTLMIILIIIENI